MPATFSQLHFCEFFKLSFNIFEKFLPTVRSYLKLHPFFQVHLQSITLVTISYFTCCCNFLMSSIILADELPRSECLLLSSNNRNGSRALSKSCALLCPFKNLIYSSDGLAYGEEMCPYSAGLSLGLGGPVLPGLVSTILEMLLDAVDDVTKPLGDEEDIRLSDVIIESVLPSDLVSSVDALLIFSGCDLLVSAVIIGKTSC